MCAYLQKSLYHIYHTYYICITLYHKSLNWSVSLLWSSSFPQSLMNTFACSTPFSFYSVFKYGLCHIVHYFFSAGFFSSVMVLMSWIETVGSILIDALDLKSDLGATSAAIS